MNIGRITCHRRVGGKECRFQRFIDSTSHPYMHGLVNVGWRCLIFMFPDAAMLSVNSVENIQSLGVETSALVRKKCLLCCFSFPHFWPNIWHCCSFFISMVSSCECSIDSWTTPAEALPLLSSSNGWHLAWSTFTTLVFSNCPQLSHSLLSLRLIKDCSIRHTAARESSCWCLLKCAPHYVSANRRCRMHRALPFIESRDRCFISRSDICTPPKNDLL